MSLLTVEEFDNVSHFPGKLTRKQKKQFRKNNNNSLNIEVLRQKPLLIRNKL